MVGAEQDFAQEVRSFPGFFPRLWWGQNWVSHYAGPHRSLSGLPEYHTQLERYLQYYTEAARRLGSDGNRVRLGEHQGPL